MEPPTHMTRRRNIRAEIIPACLFAGIPLLFIAGVVGVQLARNVPDSRIARANTILSFQTIRAANAVDEAVQDAERAQRGFLITGREVYLEPYTKAQERLPQLMVNLQQATSASSDQQPRLLRRSVAGGNPQRGAVLIAGLGCGSCHDIPGVRGADGRVGPPLGNIGERTIIAGMLPNTPALTITSRTASWSSTRICFPAHPFLRPPRLVGRFQPCSTAHCDRVEAQRR
jgi:hypothetical protein